MVTFSAGGIRFSYRVGAVVVREGQVLLMRNLAEDYWFTPGGRVEFGETAPAAVAREMTEEIGAAGRIERLIWVNENFFRLGDTSHHELALYFLVSLPEAAHRDFSVRSYCEEAGGSRFEVVWHELEALKTIRLVPGFLTEALTDLPSTAVHIVQVDEPAS
ncbi:MAG: NUDIX domain-containing protein [Deltaproteobacteria bacterium]|jgi:ADP-ribose pyrophosphatase YjhB (NUDIX family)|nr:NUDIX domain-containing protein [Deltaproteobacteria bacterium]